MGRAKYVVPISLDFHAVMSPGLSLLKVFKLEILSKQSLLLVRKLVNTLGVLPLEQVVHLIFPHQNWCQGLATNIVKLFTERMVIRMHHKPCPPFPPTTDLSTGSVGVSKGEDR